MVLLLATQINNSKSYLDIPFIILRSGGVVGRPGGREDGGGAAGGVGPSLHLMQGIGISYIFFLVQKFEWICRFLYARNWFHCRGAYYVKHGSLRHKKMVSHFVEVIFQF